jgi:hypothetical protein
VGFSRNHSHEIKDTQIGLVVTSVVDAAMEVKDKEVIQATK